MNLSSERFYTACKDGDLKIVNDCLLKCEELIDIHQGLFIACENGHFLILNRLLKCKSNGEDDFSKTVELKASEQGDAIAQLYLGILFDSGFGIEIDYSKAMEWYLKSAEQGNTLAQCCIGSLYSNGQGVEQDYSKAMEWLLKADEQGDVMASYIIGGLYDCGEGVEQDYSKAMEWYLKSAEKGNVQAQASIGTFYYYGYGVEKDFSKAMEWFLKAAEQQDADSQFNIGILYDYGYGVEIDYCKAMEWYLKSADQQDENAQFYIGMLYYNGKGVEKDYCKSQYWFSKSLNSEIDFEFIEKPIEYFNRFIKVDENISCVDSTLTDENIIIRFKEKDFNLKKSYLKSSQYFLTMMNSNWNFQNLKENGKTILDMRKVQDEIIFENLEKK